VVANSVPRWLVGLDEGGLLDRVEAAVITTTLEGVILYANRYCEMLYGRSPNDLIGHQSGDYAAEPVSAELAQEIGSEILAGHSWEGEFQVRRPDGSLISVHAVNSPLFESNGAVAGVVSLAFDVTAAREREQRLQREFGAAQFLADAATLLSSSLDYPDSFHRLAELSVPFLADLCLIDVAEGDTIRRMAAVHAEPGKQRLIHALEEHYPPDPSGNHPAVRVIRGGAPELGEEMSDEFLRATTRDREHFEIAKALEVDSYMCVPLVARGRTLGAFTLVSSGSGRHFDSEDLSLAEDLAQRAAFALDNARQFSERTHAARALQASLLPPSLPEIPGLSIAVRYRAAGTGSEVGGDFYDVFEVGPGRWACVIGDVSGKGPEAGAVAGLARHTLRAAALRGRTPSGLLRVLHEALRRDESIGGHFCTVCLALLDTRPRRWPLRRRKRGYDLAISCGGHPLPILMHADGEIEVAQCRGTLLGVTDQVTLADQSIQLRANDTIVFYTDGVTEARDSRRVLFGEERLLEVLEANQGQPAETIADRIVDAATRHSAFEPRDDIALLVLQSLPR
jgi:PAS domain S-box-containing protein